MRDPNLTAVAKTVYAVLKTYCSNDKTCFPGNDLLIEQLGVSNATLKRALKELEDYNVIRRILTWDETNQKKVRLIQVLDDVNSNKSHHEDG